MGGMEGPRGLCSGAGRVGSSVGSVGDALLLWSGPHRRAAEVALLAPLGGARRSREWSAWATTGAAVWGQATLPPRPKYGAVTHHSVFTRGRPSWPPRSFLEIPAWDRAEPRPPTAHSRHDPSGRYHPPPASRAHTSLVGEEPSHLWPAFPSDPLGFSQIPGHCATQCRVVVIPDMVALTQNKIWVSLTSRRPHTSSTRTRRDQKSQRKCSPSAVARSRAQAASGCRRARATAVHGGAERLSLLSWARLASR